MGPTTYVLYHANCYDGFGAAFAAWKKFGASATYIAVAYGYPPPAMPGADFIYIVDFSYDKEILLKLAETAHVVVIDHHKTAQEKLEPLIKEKHPKIDVHFNMEKSGALLSWEYFNQQMAEAHDLPMQPVPKLIEHISDRDLWTYKIPGSREVHAALVSHPFSFELYESFLKDDPNCDGLIVEGAGCLRFQASVVDKIIKGAWLTKIDGIEVPIVNTTQSWSEVGEELLKKYPQHPFAASFTVFNDQVMWSLRSRAHADNFDVSAVAKKFGGGGHRNAAGFKSVRY